MQSMVWDKTLKGMGHVYSYMRALVCWLIEQMMFDTIRTSNLCLKKRSLDWYEMILYINELKACCAFCGGGVLWHTTWLLRRVQHKYTQQHHVESCLMMSRDWIVTSQHKTPSQIPHDTTITKQTRFPKQVRKGSWNSTCLHL